MAAETLDGKARLAQLHGIFHMDEQVPFRFEWDWLAPVSYTHLPHTHINPPAEEGGGTGQNDNPENRQGISLSLIHIFS